MSFDRLFGPGPIQSSEEPSSPRPAEPHQKYLDPGLFGKFERIRLKNFEAADSFGRMDTDRLFADRKSSVDEIMEIDQPEFSAVRRSFDQGHRTSRSLVLKNTLEDKR